MIRFIWTHDEEAIPLDGEIVYRGWPIHEHLFEVVDDEWGGNYYPDEIYETKGDAIRARKETLNTRLTAITNQVAAFYEKYPNA